MGSYFTSNHNTPIWTNKTYDSLHRIYPLTAPILFWISENYPYSLENVQINYVAGSWSIDFFLKTPKNIIKICTVDPLHLEKRTHPHYTHGIGYGCYYLHKEEVFKLVESYTQG